MNFLIVIAFLFTDSDDNKNMFYLGSGSKSVIKASGVIGDHNDHGQTAKPHCKQYFLGTLLLVLLVSGTSQAVNQDPSTISDITKSLGINQGKPDGHRIKHFTFYRNQQKYTPTVADAHSRHNNEVTTYSTSEGCTITVDDQSAKWSENYCNCTQYWNKSHGQSHGQSQGQSHVLDDALACATQSVRSISVEIKLDSKQLPLFKTHTFEGGSGIRFTGMPTTIVCNRSQDSGLRFWNSTNIVFDSITLLTCGAQYNSTSRNFVNPSSNVTSWSAIFLLQCYNVTLRNVTVTQSEGTGLVMVNCGGTICINESHFVQNSINENIMTPGGGGVSIELVGKSTTLEDSSTVGEYSNTLYYITNCNFSGNIASTGKFYTTHIVSTSYFTYGQGGGVSVHFGSDSLSNRVEIRGCHFGDNKAQRGAGLFVSFREYSTWNNVSVENSVFHNNSCHQAQLPPGGNYSSGGGLMIIHYTNSKANSFRMQSSNITNNTAYFGGGLSLGGATDYNNGTRSNFSITGCVFDNNTARIGAAIDLYYRISVKETNRGSSIFPKISDSNFTRNGGIYRYSTDGATGRTFATIYIVYIPTQFHGIINIIDNTASGFGIEEATVQFSENSIVKMMNNTAKIGGGMAMIGRSTVVLHQNTQVIFHSNFATEEGGAIFSSQSQERYTAYDYTCFVQYSDYSCPPADWNSTLTFKNNKAGNYAKNDIYASSVLPCVWPKNATSELKDDIKETFCGWKNSWIFEDATNCNCSIKTAPSKFKNITYRVSVTPGNLTKISNFSVLDDLGHDVSSSALYTVSKITPPPNDSESISLKITVTNEGILWKSNNSYQGKQFIIILQTADRKSVSTTINVTVNYCPPGYQLNKLLVCKCLLSYNFNGKINCLNSENFTSRIFAGNCITFSNIKLPNNTCGNKLIVARCPYVVGQLTSLYNLVPNYGTYSPSSEDLFCMPFKRTGKLCGKCIREYGLDVYSTNFQCIKCSDQNVIRMNWIKVIAASTLPTTLLFVLCTVFHISITSARINGYIFFSHVITMRLDMLMVRYAWANDKKDAETLSNLLYVPYQLWAFNFPQILLNNTCLGEDFKVTHALALQYLSVLYPLLLVFMAIILIELHAKNFKPLVWLWKPLCYLCVRFRHSWHIRTSVIDTFASFLLLSYSNLIGVSMSLITPNSIFINNGTVVGHTLNYDTSVTFFEQTHLKFGVFAVIILSTFGAIPPILLIVYPFRWFQYTLNKCNLRGCRFLQVFVDAFQGSYKNNVKGYPERRYFAGVYFLFRITINLIYVLVEDMVVLHLTLTITYTFFTLFILVQRPYKKNFYNILDGGFMALLVVIHALTVYLLYHAIAFGKLPNKVWYLTYSIQHIPTLYMILLVLYLISFRMHCVKRLCRKCFGAKVMFYKNQGFNEDKNDLKSPLSNHDWPSSSSLVIPSPSSPHEQSKWLSDIPDRVENPQRYEKMVDSWKFSSRRGGPEFSEIESKSKEASNYGSLY